MSGSGRVYKVHVQDAERAVFRAVDEMVQTRVALGLRMIGGVEDHIAEAKAALENAERAVLAAAEEWQELAEAYDAFIDLTRGQKAARGRYRFRGRSGAIIALLVLLLTACASPAEPVERCTDCFVIDTVRPDSVQP